MANEEPINIIDISDKTDSNDGVGFICPSCGKEVATSRGLTSHISKMHGGGDSKTPQGSSKKKDSKESLKEALTTTFVLIGFVLAFIDNYDAQIIISRANLNAEILDKLAQDNDVVYKSLKIFIATTQALPAIGAIAMGTVFPIVARHKEMPPAVIEHPLSQALIDPSTEIKDQAQFMAVFMQAFQQPVNYD